MPQHSSVFVHLFIVISYSSRRGCLLLSMPDMFFLISFCNTMNIGSVRIISNGGILLIVFVSKLQGFRLFSYQFPSHEDDRIGLVNGRRGC